MHSRISFVITARAALLILQGDSWILIFLIVLLLITYYMINLITWKSFFIVGFHFNIVANKCSNVLPKFSQSQFICALNIENI